VKKKSIKRSIMPNSGYSLLEYAFLLLLLVSPFIKRINFETFFYIFGLTLGILVLYSAISKSYTFDTIDYLFMGLCIAYGLSVIGAESPRTALLAFFWQITYFLCFLFVRNFFSASDAKKKIILIFSLSLTIISLLSILNKLGLTTLNDLVISGRLAGTFEYANTFAALLVVGIIMMYVLIFENTVNAQNSTWSILGYVSLFILTLALFLTASRGGFLVYGAISLILIIVSRTKFRMGLAFLIISASSFALSYGIEHLTGASQISRLVDAENAGLNSMYRLFFYKDGLQVFQDTWLLGTGAGGWELLYPQYQPFQYHTKFIHSSFIQSLVDVGIVGTLLIVTLIVCALYQIVFNYIKGSLTTEGKAIALGFMALCAHSLIDFDLSLPIVAIYFYTFLGLIYDRQKKVKRNAKLPVAAISSIVIIACLIVGLGDLNAYAADKLIMAGKYESQEVIEKLSNSLKFDPINTRVINALGEHMASVGQKKMDFSLIEESIALFDKAAKLEPNNYKSYLAKGKVFFNIGKYDEAIKQYERIIALMPYQNTGYEFIMRAYITRAIKESDEKWAKEALNIYSRALRQDEMIDTRYKGYVMKDNLLSESIMLNFHAGVANVILKEYEAGLDIFRRIRERASESLQVEIDAWMYCAETRLGEKPSLMNVNKELVSGVEDILNEFNKI